MASQNNAMKLTIDLGTCEKLQEGGRIAKIEPSSGFTDSESFCQQRNYQKDTSTMFFL